MRNYMRGLGLLLGVFLAHPVSAAAAPTIFNTSPTANAGDIISLQGDGFGATPYVQYSHNDTNWATAPDISVGINQLTAQIPKTSSPTTDLLTVRISADNVNWSAPVSLNRAHAMSYDTPEVAAGSPFRIFGRNLSLGATPTVRFVDTAAAQSDYGQSQYGVVDTTSSSADILHATAPAGILAGGLYSVYVSNGLNGNNTSGGETLAEETLNGRSGGADPWSLGVPWGASFSAFSSNVYNVQNDPRLTQYAVGDGVANDQPAIQAAINAAVAAGGGVVFLPAGTYKMVYDPTQTPGLLLGSNVVVAGAGIGQTTLQYGFGTPSTQGWQGYGITFGNGWNPVSDCGVADMTIQNVNTSGTWEQNLSLQSNINANNGQTSSELFLQRVHLEISYGNSVPIGNANKVAIENSQLDQLGVTADYTECYGAMSHFIYRGNTVNWSGGQAMNISFSTDGIIENNTFVRNCNYSLYTQTINTRCMDNNFDTNLTILNNSFSVTGGPVNDQYNDGETILNEGGGPFRADPSYGTATGGTATTLQDTTQNWPSFSPNAVVVIISGTGMGQWRHITGYTANTLTVDQPWLVAPDSTSGYSTTDWAAVNWLIQGNTLSNNRAGIMLYDASSHDVAIVGNTLTNNGGILIQPLQYTDTSTNFHELDPIWNTQVVGNTVTDTNGAEPAFIGVSLVQWDDANTLGAAALGVEIRGNTITATTPPIQQTGNEPDTEGYYNVLSAEVFDRNDTRPPGIVGTIFQGNTANNCASVYRVDWGVDQTTIADSLVNNTPAYLVDDVTVVGARHPGVNTVVLNTVYTIPPVVASIAPSSGPVGTTVTLTGTYFTGATAVTFNGTGALGYVVNSDTQITVTVPAGATTGHIAVTTPYGTTASSASFTVTPTPITIASVSFNPSTLIGGVSATGTVTLTGPAPAGNAVVHLTTSSYGTFSVPSTVQINTGQTTHTFTATAHPVTKPTTVTITATYNGVTATTTVTVNPAPVYMSAVSFSPSTLAGAATTTGTLTLTAPAPLGNAVVHLTSSNTAVLAVPVTVTLAAGQATQTFTATSHNVSVATTVTVTATYNGTTQTAAVTVNPVPVPIASVSFTPASVTGGASTTGTLTLTGPAPVGAAVVHLTSSNPVALYVPATAQINAGLTSRTFSAVSRHVASTQVVTVTATYGGATATTTVTVTP